jgi:hypothetical protein
MLESSVTLRNRVGIVENENGRFEANSVLCEGFAGSSPRPIQVAWLAANGKEYGPAPPVYQYICMYTMLYAGRAQRVSITTRSYESQH